MSGKYIQKKKKKIEKMNEWKEKFRVKVVKSSETVVQSCYTDYLFKESQQTPPELS